MVYFTPKLSPGEKIIQKEGSITGGGLKVSDAYDLILVQKSSSEYELRLFMKLQFFFKDDGINRWSKADQKKFIVDWENIVRKIWDGYILKILANGKTIKLKLEFEIQIAGFMFDHWEITVKKTPPGAVFRSFVRPGMKDVTLTENDNGITVRNVRAKGGFKQVTSAHEFGHMLGLDDEYGVLFGGVKGSFDTEYNSIMNIGSDVKKRHMNHLIIWLNKALINNGIK